MNNSYNDKKSRYDISLVKLEDVDRSIHDYFNKRLNIQVDTASEKRKKVPVLFATGERWKLIRERKGIRDDNKTLILPLITISRTNVDRTTGFGGMTLEVPSITVKKKLHQETGFLLNNLEQRSKLGFPTEKKGKAIYEILTIPFPDFNIIYYDVLIWTQYMSQMNEILEKIFFSYDYMDSFVMPLDSEVTPEFPKGKGYYFVGFRDNPVVSSQSNFEEFTDDERIIRYSYSVKVPAYLILDPKDETLKYGRLKYEREFPKRNAVYIQQTNYATSISTDEEVLSLEEFKEKFGNVKL